YRRRNALVPLHTCSHSSFEERAVAARQGISFISCARPDSRGLTPWLLTAHPLRGLQPNSQTRAEGSTCSFRRSGTRGMALKHETGDGCRMALAVVIPASLHGLNLLDPHPERR